jgi:hypothetical protein
MHLSFHYAVTRQQAGTTWDAAHSWGPKPFTIALTHPAVPTPTPVPAGGGGAAAAAAVVRGTEADGAVWDLAILSTSIGMMSHVTKTGLDFKGIVGNGSVFFVDWARGGCHQLPMRSRAASGRVDCI